MQRWSLPVKIERLLAKDDREKVLYLLSRITALNSKDFASLDQDYLRFVGQYRISLLIDWFMYREALAWTCLECELYPDNKEYQILKETLKAHILNLPDGKSKNKVKVKPWKDVAGMYDLKSIIERDIIRPLSDKALYERFGVEIPSGFLLYGPPGCGKTFFASKIAERIGYNFIQVKTSDIASTYVHGTQIAIKKIFEDARKKTPAVLFFDEIEAMVPSRTRVDVSFHYKSEVDEFLAQIDKKLNKGLIIIGATNHLKGIDDAILRPGRFDRKIFIGPPDITARAEAFKVYLKDFPQRGIRYDYIAEISKNFTYSDIELICNEIKNEAISTRLLSLDTNIVGKFVTRYRPGLNDEKLSTYY